MTPDRKYERGSLVRRSLRALQWSYLGVGARVVLQLTAQIALARLLGPTAFGEVAAAMAFVLVAGIVVELGQGVALVQAPKLEPADIKVAFTRVVLAALGAAAIIVISADLVAALFDDEQVAPVLRWMTLALVFQALGAISLGLLRRNLDFKSVQIAQVTSYFVGFVVVGVSCAWLGAGEWSLVAAWVTQTLVASAIQYARAPHPLGLTLRPGQAPLMGFGLRTVVASMANWSIENLDTVMVGRAFGTTTLGAYSIAYNLVRTPVNHMVFALQQVLQPFTARARDDRETVGKAYLTLLWVVSLVAMPTFFGLAALAPTAIEALYGPAWIAAIPVLVPLAAAMPLQAIQAVGGPVLWGTGRVGREIVVSFSVAALLVAVLALAAHFSVVAMAWGVWLVYLIRSVWITAIVSKLLGLPVALSLSMARGGALVGVLTAALLFGADQGLTALGIAPLARLGLVIALGAVLLPTLAFLLMRAILPAELRDLVTQLLERLPPRLRGWLGRCWVPDADIGDCALRGGK
jgi:PST family polysaccharide transporter